MEFVLTHLLGLVVIKKGSILHNPLTETEKILWFAGSNKLNIRELST